MPKIKKLPQNLINKIAAGEVVERPASVVKELVENSIDAKATKITVNIKDAGKKLIQIIDNGSGMDNKDAQRAFEHHATSKIDKIEDLDTILTMGFRGEALSSIGAVSKVTLTTKSKTSKHGTKIEVENENITTIEEVGAAKGTNLKVEDIFFNVPARKKFLKGDVTELKHIIDTFLNLALSHTSIHFVLNHNNKELYNLPSASNLQDRIHDIFGKSMSENLIEITYEGPKLSINGLVGHPSIAKSQRNYQYMFINNRPIQDSLIAKAVYDGFEGTIPKNRYPVFFLFLKIDPKEVDVNVHPRKLQVKFKDTSLIFKSVKTAVRSALHKKLQDNIKAVPAFKNREYKIESKKSSNTLLEPKQSYKTSATSHTNKNLVKQSLIFSKSILENSDIDETPELSKQPFQIFDTYIIFEYKDKLWIIDQHAAAERVTYEKLSSEKKKKSIETQQFLLPETVELSKQDSLILKDNLKDLENYGIKIEEFGETTFKITELPTELSQTKVKKLIEDILEDIKSSDIKKKSESLNEIEEKLLATMACHNSIRAGMKLELDEIKDLVSRLTKCDNPYSCPHGRPIIWELTKSEVDKNFERH